MEREETTLDEVYERLLAGTFYEDYDWASGPGLRAIRRAKESLDGISSLAVCVCITPSSEHYEMLENAYRLAEEGLGRECDGR